MDHSKQKKKPVAKLEQIIAPDKEKSPSAKPDTVSTVIEPPVQCNATCITYNSRSQRSSKADMGLEFSVSGTKTVITDQTPIVKQMKKRGRKRKIPIDEKYNNPEYVVMWPEICMTQKVLVDRYDNVYTYDLNSPIWLGVKTVFGKIDNTTYTAPLTKYYFQ